MAVLVPNLSSGGYDPYSFGIAETYSYIPIANDQGRPIFAKASYITNLSDLVVSITAGNVDIGAVHLLDHTNGLYASIANIGLEGIDAGAGAVRVLTQDFESTIDDITIGDKNGNFASVNAAASALNVYNVNPVTAVQVLNPVSAVSITNQLTGITILNPVTAIEIANDSGSPIPVSGSLSATIFNPVTAVTVNNLSTYIGSLTSTIATANNQIVTNTLLNTLTANNATSVNQTVTNTLLNTLSTQGATEISLATAGNTLLNSLTASQATEITLQKSLTANNATSANQLVTNTLLNSLTANVATASNQNATNSLLNSLTANNATSVNQLNTNSLLNSLTANVATSVNQVNTNTLLNTLTANVATAVNQVNTNTLLNSLTSSVATATNQTVTNTLLNTLTANVATAANQNTTNTLLNALTANVATATNQTVTNTLLNSLTASETTLVTLTKVLTSNNATAVNQVATNTLLNSLTANVATAVNQTVTNTLLNSLTANVATANNQVTTNTLLNSVTANQATALNQASTNTLLNSLTSNVATSINQVTTNTLLNTLSTELQTSNTLLNTISAYTYAGTVSSSPRFVDIVPNTNASPILTKYADSLQLDPLGRLRTANTTNQWWYQASVDKDGDLRFTEQFTALSAQSVYVPGIAAITLTPGLSSTGSAIRQTRRYFKHRPGVGHQVFFTLNWSGAQTSVVKRMGQYDSTDGMFFELSGTSFNVVVRRTLADGTLVEDRTNSANFSNDKLDGTGPSGLNFFTPAVTAVNLSAVSVTTVTQTNYPNVYNVVFDTNGVDLTSTYKVGSKISVSGASNNLYNGIAFVAGTSSTQLTGTYTINPGTLPSGRTISTSQTPWNMEWTFWFDYIGGRTSRVRFVIASPSQGPVLLHTYSSGGTLGTQFVNDTASPLRYEIFNTQTQTVLPILTLGAEAIDIEAEASQNPNFTSAFNNTGVVFNKTTGTERPLIGVGLRAGQPYQRGDIQFQTINFTENGNNLNNAVNPYPTYYWRLVLNPTITGTITATNVGKASQSNTYAANATLSGGQQLYSGYFAGGVGAIEVPTSLNFLNMGTNVTNTTPDIVVLCATLIGDAPQNNSTLFAGVNFIEAL